MKMKNYLRMFVLLVTVSLIFTAKAEALLFADVQYTGMIMERIDSCGYGCGYVSKESYMSNLMYAGGPAANNSVGYAQQFNVSKETIIDYLLVSAHISEMQNDFPDQTSSSTMYFKLYTGTSTIYQNEPARYPYPDVETAAIVSSLFVTTYLEDVYFPEDGVWHTFDRESYYIDEPIPLDITLQPGTYWIAQERYPDNNIWNANPDGRHDRVDGISVKFAQSDVVPEPATILLFGTSLLWVFIRKRKQS
jgi:hypothetical protein